MTSTESLRYQRIARAIIYVRANHKQQPSLDEIAERIHLNPSHFHRLFIEWAGTSPKKFFQYISVNHAKRLLQENRQTTLFDTAYETGLSDTSRLHDLFVNIEVMTPAEYKNGGQELTVRYHFNSTPFGHILVASTAKGICYLAFEEEHTIDNLVKQFPDALFIQEPDAMQQAALQVLHGQALPKIKLHLKSTPFQLKVWESLLKIPEGKLSTYGKLAGEIGMPSASRAVGTAVGNNPVAYLIPCHRVVQAAGTVGGYRWGCTRKAAIIGWESARLYS